MSAYLYFYEHLSQILDRLPQITSRYDLAIDISWISNDFPLAL